MTKRKRKQRAEPPDPKIILGFDISSVCVGFALFHERELRAHGKLILEGDYAGEKLIDFYNKAQTLLEVHNPDLVIVEKPFRGQGRAFEVLVQYHAALKMAIHKVLGRPLLPDHGLTPRQVKKVIAEERPVKRTTKRKSSPNTYENNKKDMVQRINQLYGLRLRYKENDIKKTTSDDDTADAIAVVHAWLLLHNGRRTNTEQN